MKKILLLVALMLPLVWVADAQNRYEEAISYNKSESGLIIPAKVGGTDCFLVLAPDLSTAAILSGDYSAAAASRLPATVTIPGYRVDAQGTVSSISVGQNLYRESAQIFIAAPSSLSMDPAVGYAGRGLFQDQVLTINSRDSTLIISSPYKPSYISLRNNTDLSERGTISLAVGATAVDAAVAVRGDAAVIFSSADAANLGLTAQQGTLPAMTIARVELRDVNYSIDHNAPSTVVGTGILNYGLLSIDYPRNKVYFQPWEGAQIPTVSTVQAKMEGLIEHLTNASFREKIFDYRTGGQWDFKGDLPAVIDFWATWCAPCRRIAPSMEALSKEYEGRVRFYKVDVDYEKEAAEYFKANPIPLVIFIPRNGEPIRVVGVQTIEAYRNLIDENLISR